MIKFAVLTPSLAQPGGAERALLVLIRYSDPTRMQCTGIAFSGYGSLDLTLGRDLCRYTTIHGDMPRGVHQRPRSSMVQTTYRTLNDAVKFVSQEADVLITWGSLTLDQFTAGLTIPVVCLSQCAETNDTKLSGITHLVTVSKESYRYFNRANDSARLPVYTIPNGIEVDRVCPRRGRNWQRDKWGVSESDKVLLYLGRHAKVKNPGACIRAVAKLPPQYKLLMIGNQSYAHHEPMPGMVELTRELGVADRVQFLPPEPLIGDILAGADCLLHLSFHEADSLAVKEAFLAGLPVVHTPVGSLPELEQEFGLVGWKVGLRTDIPFGANSVDSDEVASQIKMACSGEARAITNKMRVLCWERWTGPAICERWADYLDDIVDKWIKPIPGETSLAPAEPMRRYPPTDYAKVRQLPKEVVFPTMEILQGAFIPWAVGEMIGPFIGTAKGIAEDRWRLGGQDPAPPYARSVPAIKAEQSHVMNVTESETLKPVNWSSYPILVDGTEVIIDYSDWNLFDPMAHIHKHWLRYHFNSSFKEYPWLGALLVPTFKDWALYQQLQHNIRERRDPYTVKTILNNQIPYANHDSRARRRYMVRGMLQCHFADRVDMTVTNQEEFFAKAETAMCYVSVPGSWENILDRGILQMLGLGVPVISPPMFEQCCDGLLQPNIHYLQCRQDYLDIPDIINWCDKNRDDVAAISQNAWLFFQEFCTPIAIWSYIKDRIDNGPRHWREGIDDDLSPPGLYRREDQHGLDDNARRPLGDPEATQ